MNLPTLAASFASLSSISAAGETGRATVEWLSGSATYQPGKPVETGIRMIIDEGHHTYWINPGEAGMRTSVVWELPAGWTAGELEHPVPVRFNSGGLAGFGYEGTVIFPVKLTAPEGFSGEANLKGKVSWLECDDDACLPGNAEIFLQLRHGETEPTPNAVLIEAAQKLVPAASPGLDLDVGESGDRLELTLKGTTCDPSKSDVFPATPQVIDSDAVFNFVKKSDGVWTASVMKSDYLSGPVSTLTLVIAGPGTPSPIFVTYQK